MLNRLRRLLFDPRRRPWWAAVSVVLAGVLMWLATLPGHRMPDGFGWDKIDHLLAFSALAFGLWFWLRLGRWPAIKVMAVCLAFGVAIELAQLFVPSRRADVVDVLADMLGAGFGLLVAVVVQRALDRRKRPR